MKRNRWSRLLGIIVLLVGFAFLYLPIGLVVLNSFNSSRLSMVWASFSLEWYGGLLEDKALLRGLAVSLKIALWSASASTVLGTMAAIAMTRTRDFRGKALFGLMVTAPLVMPEVVVGLSILLMLVSMGSLFGTPSRGSIAIWIAHVTLTISVVTIVMSARLADLDKSLEEAAMDLGANRIKVFFLITLPLIMPSLVSSWLLAFTLSFDDFVIANFLYGPDSATLPVRIFARVKPGVSPTVNVLATLMIAVVWTVAIAGAIFMVLHDRRLRKDARNLLKNDDERVIPG